jgi:hypothetical protein
MLHGIDSASYQKLGFEKVKVLPKQGILGEVRALKRRSREL